ncbi:hypothetical protein EJ110_NYTH44783 [Nymphaea thermarum]|nr:hypothetical protein EJ110_NYTH44783 [Nymphaea thermarum]
MEQPQENLILFPVVSPRPRAALALSLSLPLIRLHPRAALLRPPTHRSPSLLHVTFATPLAIHSERTISEYFNLILKAIFRIAHEYMGHRDDTTSAQNTNTYYVSIGLFENNGWCTHSSICSKRWPKSLVT